MRKRVLRLCARVCKKECEVVFFGLILLPELVCEHGKGPRCARAVGGRQPVWRHLLGVACVVGRDKERRSCGALESRSYGAVELWSGGAVELWSGGAMELWSGGAVERWSCGAVERWSCGAVELWSCGAVKRWS